MSAATRLLAAALFRSARCSAATAPVSGNVFSLPPCIPPSIHRPSQTSSNQVPGNGAWRGASARSAGNAPDGPPPDRQKSHWVDGKLGRVLQEQNRKLWFKGIQERLRNFNIPADTQSNIPKYMDAAFLDMADKYGHLVSDERSSLHLQTACLILATHHVLLPFVRNEEELMEIIKAQMGNATSPVLRNMLKMTLYFTRDPFASTAKRLHSLRSDMGGAVDATIVESEREAKLEIHSCLYNTIFTSEQKTHLADCCCCSVDSAMYFEGLDSFGVQFSLDSRLPDSDSMCCLKVSRKG